MSWFDKFMPKKKLKPVVTVPASAPPLENILPNDIADNLLIIAYRQVGVKESAYNAGAQVEEYQKAVDGKASGEPWCLAFVQWCVNQLCEIYQQKNPLFQTEACLILWNQTPAKYRLVDPKRGAIPIWKHISNPAQGHTGISTTGQLSGGLKFNTIEGNTNNNGSRDGDGVYEKPRSIYPTETLQLVGFIDLPQMLADKIKASKV